MEKFFRRWGYYTVVYQSENTLVKLIYMNAGSSTHLQLHHHRAETWKVISGEVLAQTSNGISVTTNESDIINVGKEEIHKLTAVTDCCILEVQHGDLISEEDIEHLDE